MSSRNSSHDESGLQAIMSCSSRTYESTLLTWHWRVHYMYVAMYVSALFVNLIARLGFLLRIDRLGVLRSVCLGVACSALLVKSSRLVALSETLEEDG